MQQFSILDYGAVPNTELVQSEALQKAIDACFLAGGGEVTVPAGKYVIGDIRLRSNVTLHLLENAVLLGSRELSDYNHIFSDRLEPLPETEVTHAKWKKETAGEERKNFKSFLYTVGSDWNRGIIRAAYAENIAIIGERGSVIDGRNVYDPTGESNFRGPHAISMQYCKNLTFSGYTLTRSSNWGHWVYKSENVRFSDLEVLAGHDAVHPRVCKNVVIERCKLITGDDAVAGFNNINVRVSDCEISSACSAFRFGGADILVENCYAYGPCPFQFRGKFSDEEKAAGADESATARRNMLSFFTAFVTDEFPIEKKSGNIVIRNCRVVGADRLLHLNLSGNEVWQSGAPPTDITFRDVTVEGLETGLYAYGVEGEPMELRLENVSLSFREGCEKEPLMKAAHFDRIGLSNVDVKNFEGEALILCWSDGGTVETEALRPALKADRLRARAEAPFECKRI